jgi:hypothetical protein
MKKTIYQVSNPYNGDEYEIYIEEYDINYVLGTEYENEFNTLEEAKAFIVKRYESIIESYKNLMTNITINK